MPVFCGLVAIGAFTAVAFTAGLNPAAAGFLFLITVVLAADYGGFWSATVVAVAAAACLDYFFIPPVLHWDISDPMDWIALGAFQLTALVIARLQDQAKAKTAEALAERLDSERLYDTARGMLLLDRSAETEPRMASLIRETFGLRSVVVFDARTEGTVKSGNSSTELEQGSRDAFLRNSYIYDPRTETWYCALRAGSQVVGGLALCGTSMPAVRAQAICSLCAMLMERVHSFEKETRAEAARQAEQLRTAVVEALAHQIKTPLCVIQAASSGLLVLGKLSEMQTELATSIDAQAAKLNDLVSRLLGTAALDSTEIKPRLAPVMLSPLLESALQGVEDRALRGRVQVSAEEHEAPALADEKLIRTVLQELVDNALKYSAQRSPVTVTISHGETEIRLVVHNEGVVIAPADRELIFERFYRTKEARQGPAGTGLGLSIVKRIVEAHQGHIGVESGPMEGTNFCLSLPRA